MNSKMMFVALIAGGALVAGGWFLGARFGAGKARWQYHVLTDSKQILRFDTWTGNCDVTIDGVFTPVESRLF